MAYLHNNKLGSANYITIKVVDDALANGANLLSTYETAKNIKPNNNNLSSSNRLALIIPPGVYDLQASPLTLDTQYIDLIGSTNDKSKHYIKSSFDQPYYGAVVQFANDIKLINLTIESSNTTYTPGPNPDDVTAYSPDDNLNLTYIENVEFKSNNNSYSMRPYGFYLGTYINCIAGDFSFGSKGGANGIFENCKGGNFSFGASGQANGIFKNCKGGISSFKL